MMDFIMEHQILSAIIAIFALLMISVYYGMGQDYAQRKDNMYGPDAGKYGRKLDRERNGIMVTLTITIIVIVLVIFILWKLMS